jgi:hypothetical protein
MEKRKRRSCLSVSSCLAVIGFLTDCVILAISYHPLPVVYDSAKGAK